LSVSELPVRPDDANVLSLVLSHSPDQFAWAQGAGFKLMLAGHTHGGQGRLPLVGAVLTPCLSGVKYSAGVYYEPPTLLHVTRGISGMMPVRINCPPELTKLVLRAV
jgi:predicted MPP superfamily phosphohydrolase